MTKPPLPPIDPDLQYWQRLRKRRFHSRAIHWPILYSGPCLHGFHPFCQAVAESLRINRHREGEVTVALVWPLWGFPSNLMVHAREY